MSRIITIDQRNMKERFDDFKWNFKWKMKQVGQWCIENKELVMWLTPIVIGGATTVVKVVGKTYNLKKQESVKNLYCYDRSLGHYWSLRRELSNREWIEIDQRKQNGERLADILESMKVLK